MTNDALAPTRPFPPAEPLQPIWRLSEPRQRFQHVVWKHVLLFLLTLATTTVVGAGHYQVFLAEFNTRAIPSASLAMLSGGLWYSLTILSILGAHEMGHYLACRRYQVDASLPYFLPLPPSIFGVPALTGTLGAVIRIREAFPDRKVLFDIAVAGPLAGFAVLVPALFVGMQLSTVVPAPPQTVSLIYLGEPLLFKLAGWLTFGTIGPAQALNIHPMVFACWFGMLATALNLLPFGQLDGGHISYATLRRWSTPISFATVAGTIALTFMSVSWIVMAIMMVVMLILLGPRHPVVIDEHEPLGRGRTMLAVVALVVFVLCVTPFPITMP